MMMFWWILVLIPLIVILWWALSTSRKQTGPEKEDPLKILKERYARGEIDKEEFEEKKNSL